MCMDLTASTLIRVQTTAPVLVVAQSPVPELILRVLADLARTPDCVRPPAQRLVTEAVPMGGASLVCSQSVAVAEPRNVPTRSPIVNGARPTPAKRPQRAPGCSSQQARGHPPDSTERTDIGLIAIASDLAYEHRS